MEIAEPAKRTGKEIRKGEESGKELITLGMLESEKERERERERERGKT